MRAQLDQADHAQLGKGGLKAPRCRLRQFRENRRCVEHTELRAVYPHQAITTVETVRMHTLLGQRLQRHRLQLLEQIHRNILPPLAERRIAHGYTVQLLGVPGHCAAFLQLMVNESTHHLLGAHQWGTARSRRVLLTQLSEVVDRNHAVQHIQELHRLHGRTSQLLETTPRYYLMLLKL